MSCFTSSEVFLCCNYIFRYFASDYVPFDPLFAICLFSIKSIWWYPTLNPEHKKLTSHLVLLWWFSWSIVILSMSCYNKVPFLQKRREEMERLEKERQAELRSYKGLMVSEKMTSNKQIAATSKSLQELEDDFMWSNWSRTNAAKSSSG